MCSEFLFGIFCTLRCAESHVVCMHMMELMKTVCIEILYGEETTDDLSSLCRSIKRYYSFTDKFSMWSRSFSQCYHRNMSIMDKISEIFYMKFLTEINYDASWARTEFHNTTCSCFA